MPFEPQHAVAWSEIPTKDMDKAVAYYNAVFDYGLTINTDGPNPMAILPGSTENAVSGHIYPGTPAPLGQGPTLHLIVQGKLEDAITRVEMAGGTVLSPPIEIPNGRFAYTRDLDGNSIGLFEAAY